MLKEIASAKSAAAASVYAFGPHRVDAAGRTLTTSGAAVPLTPKAFDLLVALIERRERVVGKDELVQVVWPDTFVTDDSLTQQISTLRKALGETAHDQQFIATFPRRGYRFVADVFLDEGSSSEETPLPTSAASAVAGTRSRRRWALGATAVVLVAAAAIAVLFITPEKESTDSPLARQPVRLTTAGGLVHMPAISRDGTMIAYSAPAPGESHFDIWVQQVAGGQALRLTTDAYDDFYPVFSPDGATIAFQRPLGPANVGHRPASLGESGIFLVPTLGGEPRLFVEGGRRPTFSPDGRWLAYTRGAGVALSQMFVAPLAGGAPRRLANNLSQVHGTVWSPDGAYVLTAGNRERWPPFRVDWFLVPIDGGLAIETGASAVLKHTFNSGMSADENTRGFPRPQAWHADRVLYHALDGDTKNLWRVRIDPVTRRVAGASERVTHGTDDEELASISSTGRMVYTSYDLRVDLWTVPLRADGVSPTGPPQQLTNDVVDDFNPNVSPDGRLLVYGSRRSGGSFVVVVRDLATGQERESGKTDEMPGPVFSPDGRRVAYSVRRPGGGPLFMADLAAGSPEQLCEACGVLTQWHGTMGLVSGSLFSQSGLTLFSTQERRERTLLKYPGLYLFVPSFSPDARWLTFSLSAEEGKAFFPSIVITPVRDGVPAPRAEWITVAEGHQLGRWSSRGDALIFWSACEGMPCISAQRLDPFTRRPVGPRLEIARFPDRTLSPRDIEPSNGLTVGPTSIVFSLGSKRGNLWMTTLQRSSN